MSLKPLAPTSADLRKWRRLIKEVRRVAAHPKGPGGDLRAAAATARRAVAPSRDLLLSCCSPLLRLAETFPTLGDACRAAAIVTMNAHADVLAAAIGDASPPAPPTGAVALPVPVKPGPEPEDDLFEQARTPRRDVYG